MKGRRIQIEVIDGKAQFPLLEQPGDYAGPVMGFSGPVPAVFFLKPNARDPNAPKCARAIQHVVSPPHVFTEEPDGTLTITASIGDMHGSQSDGYHCYLTKGEWIKC
jgi:hypothetical protein